MNTYKEQSGITIYPSNIVKQSNTIGVPNIDVKLCLVAYFSTIGLIGDIQNI